MFFNIKKLLICISTIQVVVSQTSDAFLKDRELFLAKEDFLAIGKSNLLDPLELNVNNIIMRYKNEEIERGLRNISEYFPAISFLKVKRDIEKRLLFHLLQTMPKGAALHGHDTALVSTEYVVKNLTYRDNLYAKFATDDFDKIIELRFISEDHLVKLNFNSLNAVPDDEELVVTLFTEGERIIKLKIDDNNTEVLNFLKSLNNNEMILIQDIAECVDVTNCTAKSLTNIKNLNLKWTSLETIRVLKGDNYVEWMTKQLSFTELDANLNVNESWKKFASFFQKITPMLTYKPVWEDHIYQTYKEFYDDNISYMEIRGTLPTVYYLNGTILNAVEVCGIYADVLKKFKDDHPKFFDARFIYAPHRLVNNETFEDYIKTAQELKETYPDFLAGFDLVGQEDKGEPLIKFYKSILDLKSHVDLYFHAGETKWSGTETDINLIDAVLLGTKRIGHAFALTKHPLVAKFVKEHEIGIEVCPISNQVLGLVSDLKNHPSAHLIANNYSVVISSDDPGFWGAKGVTYDWYEVFVGIASKRHDLHLLKQLVLNSINQSSLPDNRKQHLLKDWQKRWAQFLDTVTKKYNNIIDINEVDSEDII